MRGNNPDEEREKKNKNNKKIPIDAWFCMTGDMF